MCFFLCGKRCIIIFWTDNCTATKLTKNTRNQADFLSVHFLKQTILLLDGVPVILQSITPTNLIPFPLWNFLLKCNELYIHWFSYQHWLKFSVQSQMELRHFQGKGAAAVSQQKPCIRTINSEAAFRHISHRPGSTELSRTAVPQNRSKTLKPMQEVKWQHFCLDLWTLLP